MKANAAPIQNMADVVGLVARAPRTVREIVGITGLTPMSVRRYLDALAMEGLLTAQVIRRPGASGTANEWRWVA